MNDYRGLEIFHYIYFIHSLFYSKQVLENVIKRTNNLNFISAMAECKWRVRVLYKLCTGQMNDVIFWEKNKSHEQPTSWRTFDLRIFWLIKVHERKPSGKKKLKTFIHKYPYSLSSQGLVEELFPAETNVSMCRKIVFNWFKLNNIKLFVFNCYETIRWLIEWCGPKWWVNSIREGREFTKCHKSN